MAISSDPSGSLPVLWHLRVSNYNEKARWALDYKQIPHRRKAIVPGRHPRIARRLTGGTTFPVLELDGTAIGDSTAIIAALEERYPDRPLYPDDDEARHRALALEDFFDEELGPYSRLLAVHHLSADAGLFLATFTPEIGGPRRAVARAAFPAIRAKLRADFGIDDASAADAFERLRRAGERFRAELGPGGYLVDSRFTVADLTLAALIAPIVCPEEFPYPQPQRGHPLLAEVRAVLAESGLLDWTKALYAEHRGVLAEVEVTA